MTHRNIHLLIVVPEALLAMASDCSSYFPPETLDVVIDHLHDDPASLAACGLACRSLLPSSRYHLFSDVRFTPWNLASFLELITQSSITDIASSVRSVAIDNLLSSDINYHTARHNISLALDVTRHLRSVTSLSISQLNMKSHENHENTLHPHLLAMLSNLPEISDLEFSLVYYNEGDRLFDIIHAFPKLQFLSVRKCHWIKPLSSITVQRPFKQNPLYLREMDLCFSPRLTRQVRAAHGIIPNIPISGVQCFKLSCSFCPDRSVQQIVDAIGWSVEKLFVGLLSPYAVCKYLKTLIRLTSHKI